MATKKNYEDLYFTSSSRDPYDLSMYHEEYDMPKQPTTVKGEVMDEGGSKYVGPGASKNPEDEIGGGRGKVNPPKVYKKGGKLKSLASKKADGCITKGHTKGRFV